MLYTFNFRNRNERNSFREMVLGIIVAYGTDNEKLKNTFDEEAEKFWLDNGFSKSDLKNGLWASRYSLRRSRQDDNKGAALFVFANFHKEKASLLVDYAMNYMSACNGIEATYADYKRINQEFEQQFVEHFEK